MKKIYSSLIAVSVFILPCFPSFAQTSLTSSLISQSNEPLTAEDYFYRGLAFFENDNYENALADFTKALNIEEDIVTLWYRASSYNLLNQYNESLVDANRGLVLNPNDPDFYFIRGLANYGLEKKNDAINDLQKAINLYQQVNNEEVINEIKKLIGRIRATM
jgi:tetratricopeptide (TPR) repeat protein